ncbi:ComF family protein [Thioalkalivibrio sp. K90mix]|uniref:ComF family protein n=2 Tax=unclassified Thioalkalivibrio TaxID=2621013 RepID=UPI0001959C20|nr:phosphoribosyltransferase [Thioalkalivibrio sp. K90mix]
MQKRKHTIMAHPPSATPGQTGERSGALRALSAWAARALYPDHCGLCLAPLPEGGAICPACRKDLVRVEAPCPGCAAPLPATVACPACQRRPPAVDALRAPWAYAWPLDRVLLAYKRSGHARAERILVDLAAQAARERRDVPTPLPTRVVPVPLHPSRLRERGFNQCEPLARCVAEVLGLPLDTACVRRVRATPSQQTLSGPQRRRNLRDAFAVNAELAGERVLLVDDVVTTGATLDALARALRAAGAASVEGLALARA